MGRQVVLLFNYSSHTLVNALFLFILDRNMAIHIWILLFLVVSSSYEVG